MSAEDAPKLKSGVGCRSTSHWEAQAWIRGDPGVRQRAYKVATELAIAMGLGVYVYQSTAFWFFRSWLKGYEMQENPISVGTLLYYWLAKE